MTAGAIRQALICTEAIALRQKEDGTVVSPASKRLLYDLQAGQDVRVPGRLVRVALDVHPTDLHAWYLLTVEDRLIPLDAAGKPRGTAHLVMPERNAMGPERSDLAA